MANTPPRPEEVREHLKRMITEVTDLIHEHGIRQIIGAGPSASPFTRAIAAAYRQRHDIRLKVQNLGNVAETLTKDPAYRSLERPKIRRFISEHRPNFSFEEPSLIFDEVVFHGTNISRLKTVLEEAGTQCKTAGFAVAYERTARDLDYSGYRRNENEDIGDATFQAIVDKVYIGRGVGVPKARRTGKPEWLKAKVALAKELNGIVKSIPKG